jgi:hypothetical protein
VLSYAAGGDRETAGVALAAMNSYSLTAIIAATPLLGLTFSLPGSGRIGFVVAAGVCLMALAVVPATVTTGPSAPPLPPVRLRRLTLASTSRETRRGTETEERK